MRWLAECNNQPQTKGIRDKYSTLTCNRDCLEQRLDVLAKSITSISLPVCTCNVLKEDNGSYGVDETTETYSIIPFQLNLRIILNL